MPRATQTNNQKTQVSHSFSAKHGRNLATLNPQELRIFQTKRFMMLLLRNQNALQTGSNNDLEEQKYTPDV